MIFIHGRKFARFYIRLSVLIIAVFFFAFGQANKAYAACSINFLRVSNNDSLAITYSPAPPSKGVVTNDYPTQNDRLYVLAGSSGCGSNVKYYFELFYWNGGGWPISDSKSWQTSNFANLGMAEVRQHMVAVRAEGSNGTSPAAFSYSYYGMTKTASSSNVTAGSASLSWSLRMNHYVNPDKISCYRPQTACAYIPFYVLYGTDPAILLNRTPGASGEIGPIPSYWTDVVNPSITWKTDNYRITGLGSGTTYYWRIRAHHESGMDTFFAGGQFTTTGPVATPEPTTTITPPPTSSDCLLAVGAGIKLESANNRGLLSAKNSETAPGKFYTGGKCILGPKAAIPLLHNENYSEIESLYFEQSKHAKITLEGDQTQTGNGNPINLEQNNTDHLYHIKGSYTLQSGINIKKAGVIFIDGNLLIKTSTHILTDGDVTSGLTFIVKGNVFIDKDMTEVDAFIITDGQFCSASSGDSAGTASCLPSHTSAPQLTVKGSIIALNPANKPNFVRSNLTNTDPAEIITYQPKHLILLKGIFSRDETVWSEVP